MILKLRKKCHCHKSSVLVDGVDIHKTVVSLDIVAIGIVRTRFLLVKKILNILLAAKIMEKLSHYD